MSDQVNVAPAASAPAAFSLGDLASAVRRQKLVVTSAVLAGILIACLLSGLVAPAYVAEAELVVEPPGSRSDADLPPSRSELLPPDPAVTRTAVETIASTTILERAVKKLPPNEQAMLAAASAKTGFIGSLCKSAAGSTGAPDNGWRVLQRPLALLCEALIRPGDPAGADPAETADARNVRIVAAFVARKLDVRNDGRSYIVRVGYAGANPVLAAAVANAVVNGYLTYRAEQKLDNSAGAIASLEGKLKSLTTELHAAERRTQEIREQVRIQELRSGTMTEQQASGLLNQLAAARAKRMEAEARLEAAVSAPAGTATGGASSEVLSSRLVQQLREKEAELQSRDAELSATLGATNPAVRAVRKELAEARRSTAAEVGRIVGSLQSDASAARAEEAAIADTLRGQEQAITQSGEAYAQLREAERVTQAIAAVYDQFLLRQRELAGEQNLPEPNVRLLSPARAPLKPTGLNASTLIAVGAISGLFVGMSIAIVRRRREQRNDPLLLGRQVSDGALDVCFVPRIPNLRTSTSRFVIDNPFSAYAEALHWIRAALFARFEGSERRVVMVASALPAEGKSSFCLALASAMASAREDAVVVDCDLRKLPKEEPSWPLGDLAVTRRLPDFADLGATLHEGGRGSPSLVRLGGGRALPQAILSSRRFSLLLSSLAAEFDYVIIDTPPLAVAADALFVANQVDECLILSKWRSTPSDVVRAAVSDMRARGVPIAALIVNQAEPAGVPLMPYRPYSGDGPSSSAPRSARTLPGITVEHHASSHTPPN